MMRSCFSLCLVGGLMVTGLPAMVTAGGDSGLKKYAAHQFDEAVEECKDGKDVMSRLVLALAYTERYNVYKNKTDREAASMYLKPLEVDITLKDAAVLQKFLGLPGNPSGNKEVVRLLKKAFERSTSTPEDILFMAKFLNPARGPDANEIVVEALIKRLEPVRDYVNKGGTMPDKMQERVFSDDDLILPLIDALAEKATASDARKCLTIIEEPALKPLEEKPMTKEVSDALVSIKSAIAKRKKKFPESTWFSAAGK
jgi:hypothetical protein